MVTSCIDYVNSTLDFVPLNNVINADFHSTGAEVYILKKKKFIKRMSYKCHKFFFKQFISPEVGWGDQAVTTGSVLEELGTASISSATS